MSIRKQFLKSKPVCKVTFKIPAQVGQKDRLAHLVADFNNWSTSATPMKRLKNGAFSVTIDLKTSQSYQFRYLLGTSRWENDPDSDDVVPTHFGDSYNSVISI